MKQALTIALLAIAVSGCDCGYGGAGCGEPTLSPGCSRLIAVGAAIEARVNFTDDTGNHPAGILAAESSSPAVLGVERLPSVGGLRLSGVSPGRAELRVEVKGWEGKRFAFGFEVGTPDGGGPLADGGDLDGGVLAPCDKLRYPDDGGD